MPKRQTVTKELIEQALPEAPANYSYRVEQFSKLVWRVMLVNHQTYSYKPSDEEIATVWGFIKSTGDVFRPKNRDKISTEKVCELDDIPQSLCYTTIIPTGPLSLLHL